MSDQNPRDEDADDGVAAEDAVGPDGGAKTKNVTMTALAAIIIAIVAAAGAYVATPSAPSTDDSQIVVANKSHGLGAEKSVRPSVNEHAEKPHKQQKKTKKHKKEDKSHGTGYLDSIQTTYTDHNAYTEFPPLIVSIQSTRALRHAKIGVVVETNLEDAPLIKAHGYHIKDALNTYLRAASIDRFDDPAGLSSLKEQIKRRINLVLPNTEIHHVLITEFVIS